MSSGPKVIKQQICSGVRNLRVMKEIAIFLPNILFQDGAKFSTDASTHHKLPFLARWFDRIHLVSFVSKTTSYLGREPVSLDTRIQLHKLPSIQNGWQLYLSRVYLWASSMLKIVLQNRDRFDAALIIDSGVPSFWFYVCCRCSGIPTALYLRGRADISIVNVDRNMRGIRRIFARVMARWHSWAGKQMASRCPTVVDHDEILQAFQAKGYDARPIIATLLKETDIIKARRSPTIQPEPLQLISAGRVVFLKGIHVLLQAAHLLKKMNCRFHLRVVGPLDEAYGKFLCQQISTFGLEDNVDLVGPVRHGKDLFELMRESEIFVLPSFTEGSPKTVPEAMSQGLVVVASSVGSLPRILGNGEFGFLLSPGDPSALARLLHELAQKPDLRARMAELALKRSRELTMESQIINLVEAIDAAHKHRVSRSLA